MSSSMHVFSVIYAENTKKINIQYVCIWMEYCNTHTHTYTDFVHQGKNDIAASEANTQKVKSKTKKKRRAEKKRKKITIVNYKWCLFCVASYSFDINL